MGAVRLKTRTVEELQSMMRGTGDFETDFLNGEIVLLGRLHGVDVRARSSKALAIGWCARV